MTTTLILVTLALIARGLVEACSEKPRTGTDFLALMATGVLPVSKKARTRGDVDSIGRTRRTRRGHQ
jgi:hypothetical protein